MLSPQGGTVFQQFVIQIQQFVCRSATVLRWRLADSPIRYLSNTKQECLLRRDTLSSEKKTQRNKTTSVWITSKIPQFSMWRLYTYTLRSSLFWCYGPLVAVSHRRFLTATSSHLQGSSRPAVLDRPTLKKRPIGYPETLVSNYQSRLSNNSEERRPLSHRGGSLISRIS